MNLMRLSGLSSVSKKLACVFLLCGLFLCYLVVSVRQTTVDMAEPTQYESMQRAGIPYQQQEPLPQRPHDALPSEQDDTLPSMQINSFTREQEKELSTQQIRDLMDKLPREQIDSLFQEHVDSLSADQVNKAMLRGQMATMPLSSGQVAKLPSGQDAKLPSGQVAKLPSRQDATLHSGQNDQLPSVQDDQFLSGREGMLTSGHKSSLPSEQEKFPPMEQIKSLIGTLPREQIDSILREQAGTVNVDQIKTALQGGQVDALPFNLPVGMKTLLQVQAKTPQGQIDTLSTGKSDSLPKPLDQIKTFLQGQDDTLSSGMTGPLPRAQIKALPGEQTLPRAQINALPGEQTLPRAQINALPGEQTDTSSSEKTNAISSGDMRTLLKEQMKTLPMEQVKTVPREQLNMLPSEQKDSFPGQPKELTREEIKEYSRGNIGIQLSTVPRDQVNSLPGGQMGILLKDQIKNQGIPNIAAQSSPSLSQPSSPPKQGTNPIKALLSPQQPSNNNLGQAVPQSGNPPGTSWVKPGPVWTQGNSAAFGRPMGSQGSSVGFTPPNVYLGCDHGGSNRPMCKAVPPEDIMKIKLPPFLKEYKNPCWRVQRPGPGTPPIRCIPYFFLAGVPKSGTTDLHARLIQHPQISSIVKKEIDWFTRQRYVSAKGIEQQPKFESYVDFFIPADKDLYSNVDSKGYHDRIFDMKCDRISLKPRLICIAFDFGAGGQSKLQIRTYSDYLYFGDYEKSQALFHDSVVKNIAYVTSCLKKYQLDDCIEYMKLNETKVRLYIGIYFFNFQEFFKFLPRDQFIILKLEDYASNMAETLANVIEFLELDPLSTESLSYLADTSIIFNTRPSSGTKLGDMWPETRKILTDFFRPYNEELGKMLGQYYNYNKK